MNTLTAKGGFLPQTFNIDNDFIRAKVGFGGIRNWILFRWLPYTTYQKPRVEVEISLKKPDFEVKGISVDCDDPKTKEDPYRLSQNYYGWYAKELRKNGIYQIELPPLISGGVQYEYRLLVKLRYQYKGQEQELTTQRLIMTTGNVPHTETVFMNIISAILGSGLTLLVLWLMRIIN